MADIRCPFCHTPQDINHDDGYGYEEEKLYQQECSHCHKIFGFYTFISLSYEAQIVECLNTGVHKYKDHYIYPGFIRRECEWCGVYSYVKEVENG